MIWLFTALVILGLILVFGSHKYELEWQDGKKETICYRLFSTPNARVVTPKVPYVVERTPNKTIILVDSSAANFNIKVGNKLYKVF